MDINQIYKLSKKERNRQTQTISLIASENLIYPESQKLYLYPLNNKYSEGYPGKRYYEGCEIVDQIEVLAISAAKTLFKCKYANVQCYSGSIANRAIYQALLNPGDCILSMDMSSGGHLTHSSPNSFVSKMYNVKTYSVSSSTNLLDYDNIKELALKFRPKLIVAGSSSYPFQIDFEIFRDIADLVGAYLLADICHLSGIIISNQHKHCFPYAHIAMTTTHKQLRGARGAVILWNDDDLTSSINKSVFPGNQGGPNQLTIAQNAVAFIKSNTLEYRDYMEKVLLFASSMSNYLKHLGVTIIGTETHMFLIDTIKSFGKSGVESANLLSKIGIIVNANFLPGDAGSPSFVSGIRIGTCCLALLISSVEDAIQVSKWIFEVLSSKTNIFLVKKQIKSWLKNKKHE